MLDGTTKIVLATLDDCIRSSPVCRKNVIDRLREAAAKRGANSSYRYWLSRYDDYFAEERRHHAPPSLFTYAIEMCGEAPFLDPWLALEQRVVRERRSYSSDGGRREHPSRQARHAPR